MRIEASNDEGLTLGVSVGIDTAPEQCEEIYDWLQMVVDRLEGRLDAMIAEVNAFGFPVTTDIDLPKAH